eukprot:NODE_26_length_2576_cov_490.336367_g21_i0.p1 GENE.NODE_26_length_2576_cov_490.336367_g21_i0~~NODE_26_length_2576_cov_490.336367_g21_i0.p1  ORF type:complete len:583 (-),score=224.52 NODE_26_length_2576_cov_490.336367_g21_i0:230-1978(-)
MQVGDDPRYLKTVATPKHFTANTLEGLEGFSRLNISENITWTDMVETYLAAWEPTLKVGKAKSIMCAYNSINGTPMCAHKFLMDSIVRKKWGWDGFIVSDCDAVKDIWFTHHWVKHWSLVSKPALEAGCDVNCGWSYGMYAAQQVADGDLDEMYLDMAIKRAFKARIELGMFDPPEGQIYNKIPVDVIGTDKHHELSREASYQSMILLQNPGVLPWSKGKRILVVGPHAFARKVWTSNYHGSICNPGGYSCMTDLTNATGLANEGANVTGVMSCNDTACATLMDLDLVDAALKDADYVIAAMGIFDGDDEREGMDRGYIGLKGKQPDLVERVLAAGKPTTLVMIEGGAVSIDQFKGRANLAILRAGYAGFYASEAVVGVIFGDINPGGKLPHTVYPLSFGTETALHNFNMRPGPANPGRTYKFYSGTPLWEFGFGLSYTTFSLEWDGATPATHKIDLTAGLIAQTTPSYEVVVTNTGKIAGAETVLVFWSPDSVPLPEGAPVPPKKVLFDFAKVFLQPGESQRLFFTLKDAARTISLVDASGNKMVHPGSYSLIFSRGHGATLTAAVEVSGPAPLMVDPLFG